MRTRPAQIRGASLLMAMVVVVLLTLLVVAAIGFTGSERSASVVYSRGQGISSCADAARNLFMSQIRVLQPQATVNLYLDGGLGPYEIKTGHYAGLPPDGGVEIADVTKLPAKAVANAGARMEDITQMAGGESATGSGYYRVTAVCNDGASAREVEFGVQVGL